ncbi:MAG: protoporphyrinogen oxidase [Waddliaceae bacterium]
MPRALIIGAGITGLSAAYFLKEQCDVLLVEKSGNTGGWIQTRIIDGFLCEQGPRGIRGVGQGEETLSLVRSLGLEDQLIVASPLAKKRMIWSDGKLQVLSPLFFLKNGLVGELILEFFRRRSQKDDESIASFFTRRFGIKTTRLLADALTTGIYAGDIHTLSMRSCFPRLWEMESLFRGYLFSKKTSGSIPLFSFKDGMKVLPNALEKKVQDHLLLGTEVLSYKDNKAKLSNGKEVLYDYLIDTTPREEVLKSSIALIHLGFDDYELETPGFGYLIPTGEDPHLLGVVFDSCVFPTQNSKTKLTVMLGGARFPDVVNTPRERLIEIALSALKRQMNIKAKPVVIDCHLCKNAIPQYSIGHHQWIEQLNAKHKNHFYLGSSTEGVAVNNLISQADRLAKKIALELQ